MTNARVAAARVLMAVERGQLTLAAALEHERSHVEDARDRSLLIEIAAGTLRWQQELDTIIGAATRRPAAQLDAPVRAVLRLGAYQMRHLERIPAHAIVHESVDAVRALGAPRAAGFVNATLRGLLRGRRAPLPPRPGPEATEAQQLEYLAVTLSHPRWLVKRWLDRYGFDATAQWCSFNNTAPSPTVRVVGSVDRQDVLNRLHGAGIDASPAPYVPEAITLPPGALGRVPTELARALTIQDEGSQLVARFADARPGERVIDLCAAPGGKTTMLAEAVGLSSGTTRSMVVACDYRPSRVKLLAATLGRRQLPVPIVALDARGPLPFRDQFDCVLLDVPCSGLGTLRRDPDLKWTRQDGQLPGLVADQRRMIRMAASLVRPGGRLVYATCSSEPEENEMVVQGLLTEAGGAFSLGLAPHCVSDLLIGDDGCLRTTPFQHGLDAYFAARLVRREGA